MLSNEACWPLNRPYACHNLKWKASPNDLEPICGRFIRFKKDSFSDSKKKLKEMKSAYRNLM